MSRRIIKTILSPLIFTAIFLISAFCVSAETNDEVFFTDEIRASEEKSQSDIIEDNTEAVQEETMPTMKSAYYTQKTESVLSTDDSALDPTSAIGATSSVSTNDVTSEATPDAVKSGVVQTSDKSANVFILMGLVAGTCLLIALHKKNLVK